MQEQFYQVLHKDCYGEIVMIANELGEAAHICNLCQVRWDSETPFPFPIKIRTADDMELYKPEDEDGTSN